MAVPTNPAKTHKFLLEVGGFNIFEVQTVQMPEVTMGVNTHGSPFGVSDMKTPSGKIEVGQMTVTKIVDANNDSFWHYDNMAASVTPGGNTFNDGFLVLLNPQTGLPLRKYYCGRVFVSGITQAELTNVGEADNFTEEITLEMQYFAPEGSELFTRMLAGL